jgi:branched-chain amino acid transport system permease protein
LALAVFGIIYAVLAYGIGGFFAESGLLPLSHVAVWGAGAYFAAYAHLRWGWNFWVIILAVIPLSIILAALIGIPALRSKGHYFLIVSFAVTEFGVLVATQWTSFTGGAAGVVLLDPPDALGPIQFSDYRSFYYLAWFFLVCAVFGYLALKSSPLGRRLVATRDNPDFAQALGINTSLTLLAGFTATAVFAGVAGVLYIYFAHAIEPTTFSAWAGIQVILMAILGGTGTMLGPIVGALAVTFLPDVLQTGPNYSQMLFGAAMAILIVVLPRGVVGSIGPVARRSVGLLASLRPHGS